MPINRPGWIAFFLFVWLIGAFLGSTFEYQSTDATAGQSYSTGTANFVNGSSLVVGQGTGWVAGMTNGLIKDDNDNIWYKIISVADATDLTIAGVYNQAGGVLQSYTMQPSAGWAGSGTAGYTTSPISTLQYLMNIANAVQRIPLLGNIPIPVPNSEYFKAAYKVITWQWSFMEDYQLAWWIFCSPFVVAGVISLLAVIFNLLRNVIAV